MDNLTKYVYTIYRCKSVSAAAKKLYISQPALSASLKKAEEKLGAEIFNRKTNPFTLTPEGKVYIAAVEKMMEIEEQMQAHIQSMAEFKGGTLRVASSNYTSFYVIPAVCRYFSESYPEMNVVVQAISSLNAEKLLEHREIDVVFTYTTMGKAICSVPILKEHLLVAIRKDMLFNPELLHYALSREAVLAGEIPEEKKLTDLAFFSDMRFIFGSPSSSIYKKMRHLLSENNLGAHISDQSNRVQLNYNLMYMGLGALVTTDTLVRTMPENESCYYFALAGTEGEQTFYAHYLKEQDGFMNRVAQEFSEMAKQVCKQNVFQLFK